MGIHFDELKTEPNITPPKLGPFSVQPKTILISEKTEGYSGEWVQINLKKKAKIYY